MTILPPALVRARAGRARRGAFEHGWLARLAPLVVAVYLAQYLGLLSARPQFVRPYFAAALLLPVVFLGLTRQRHVILVVLATLPFLGLIRRLLSTTTNSNRDPVLLVAPVILAVLLFAGARLGAFSRLNRLSNAVLALCYVIVLGAFNPLQGTVAVGLAGLLFTLVPILWFWVGRTYVDDQLFRRIVVVLAVIGVLVAIYGLYQTYLGFPSWDQNWIEKDGYSSLSVGRTGTIRPFGSFVAASEYAGFLSLTFALWLLLIPRFQSIAIVMGLIVGWALFLSSARTAMFTLFLTLGAMLAIRLKLGLPGAIVLGASALFALSMVATVVRPSDYDEHSKTGNLVEHQLEGLANPFDDEASTGDVHANLVFRGLSTLPQYPLGIGTGAITIAGSAFGTGAATTEADPSNAAVAWGFPGVVAFYTVVGIGLLRTYRLAQREGGLLPFAALTFLLCTTFGWLSGGNYAVAPLPWLALGWLDGRRSPSDVEQS